MYSVLYVDDEPSLLELGRLFLEESGQLRIETCLSASSALEVLDRRRYDAIISDYQMPGMNGIAFLKAVRSRLGEIPFVLFTGKGREEVVIEAINNGADFYLQKGGDPGVQFAELEHGVLQAVLRREAERRLRESEERYRSVVNDQTEMIARFTADGTVTFVNESFRLHLAPLLGPDEVVGRNLRELMPDRDFVELERVSSSLTPEDPIREMERVVAEKDGGKRHQLYTIRALFGGDSEPGEYQFVGRDVTAERQVEQAFRLRESRLEFMLGLYEMARQPEEALLEYAVEGAGIVTDSPLGYLAFLNGDESELAMQAWSRSAMEECALRFKPLVYRTAETGLWGEPVRQRRPVITNDYAAPDPLKKGYPAGHPPIRRHMGIPVLEGDRVVLVAGVANKETDYTESDVSELSLLMQGLWQVLKRKRVESSLRESEEKHRLATETTGQLVYDYDLRTGTIRWSGAIEPVTGWTPEEFGNGDLAAWAESIHPDDRAAALAELDAAQGRSGEYHVEYRFRRKGGDYVPMENTGAFIRDAAGRAVRMVGTQKDLTTRRRDEAALKESEAKFRGMAERISDIVLLVDPDLCLTYVSPSFESLTGFDPAPLLGGRLPLDRLLPEDREKIESAVRANRALEPTGPLEIAFPTRDGRTLVLEFQGTPIVEDGRPAGVQLVAHDITGLRRAQEELWTAYEQLASTEEEVREQYETLARSERQLRESEARFRAIFDHAPVAITLSDADRHLCLAANPAFERITGRSVTEAIGRDATELSLVTPALGERLDREFRSRGSIDTFPITFARPDGETRQGLLSAIPVLVGEHQSLLTLVVDVTDQHRASTALRESQERFRRLFDQIPLGIAMVGPDLRFRTVNPAMCRMLGYSSEELVGRTFASVTYPDDVPLGVAQTGQVLAGAIPFFRMEKRYVTKAGGLRWGLVTVFPIVDDLGRVQCLIPVIEDITERRLSENALRRANRQLALLSSITRHDILNNIMVMLGYLALEKKSVADPGTMRLIERLETSIRQIQVQIEFTRLFEHLGSRDPEWQGIGPLLDRVQVPAGVRLVHEAAGWEVYGDLMLGHVFANLLDNSARHGGSALLARVTAEETERGLVVAYEDDGAGVPLQEKELIFERGYGKNSGLGLFLAREILALTGIAIRETGVPGHGARFELTVPRGSYRLRNKD